MILEQLFLFLVFFKRGARLTHLGAWGMAHGAGLTFFKVPYLRFLYIGSEYLAAKIDPRFMGRDP